MTTSGKSKKKEKQSQKSDKTVDYTVAPKDATIDNSSFRPVWRTQYKIANNELRNIRTYGPSTGDPNSPFNLRVTARAEEKQQNKPSRPRYPDGRGMSSTRVTEGFRGAMR